MPSMNMLKENMLFLYMWKINTFKLHLEMRVEIRIR